MKQLAEALAKAQAEMQNPAFDSRNPHFKSQFASLASVRNAVIPVLAKHGVFVTQELTATERGIACATIFMCGEDQFRFAPLEIPANKFDAQGFGSAATYARRYSLMAAAGVVGDEDDDANAATAKSVNSILPAPIPATVGIVESLDAQSQQQCRLAADEIQEAFDKAGSGPAADIWHGTAALFDHDARRAIWSLLDSKCRAAIKKKESESRVAEQA